jgi:hypothetical protein
MHKKVSKSSHLLQAFREVFRNESSLIEQTEASRILSR